MASIYELEALSYLEQLASDYERVYGAAPFDLSHWDPSPEVERSLLSVLDLPLPRSPMPYILPYELDTQPAVLKRLGITSDGMNALFVPTGTSALALSAWWLRSAGIEQVAILSPGYFSSYHACQMVGMKTNDIYLLRENRQWRLPCEEIASLASQPNTAIWLTNPIYCTGIYLSDSDAEYFNSLLERGARVVVDECHAINGCEIGRKLVSSERLLRIYSPHKSLCLNAFKFGLLAFEQCHSDFFERWDDVVVGGLSTSSCAAIDHFLGANYWQCQETIASLVRSACSHVTRMMTPYMPQIDCDENTKGYLISCYVPSMIPRGISKDFMRDIVLATGTTLIPGARNHFHPSSGFCFRLNLARFGPQFAGSFGRVLEFLSQFIATSGEYPR